MGDEPAWSSHARRIQPGESIRVNRDDDDDREEGAGLDDGTADRGGGMTEKRGDGNDMAQTDTTDSGTTLAGSRQYDEKAGERADVDQMERGEYTGHGDHNNEKTGDERDDAGMREEDGRETPILAEYREGNHLVRERLRDGQDEVHVEVIKDYFHTDKPSERSSFWHPQPLRKHEVDKLHEHVDDGADHAASTVKNGGEEQEDPLGRESKSATLKATMRYTDLDVPCLSQSA